MAPLTRAFGPKKEDPRLKSSTRVASLRGGSRRRLVAFFLLAAAVNLVFPPEKINDAFDIPPEGTITKKAFIAPFTFDILKTDDELKRERAEAMEKVPPVLEYDYDVTEKMFNKFKEFFANVELLREESTSDSSKQLLWQKLKGNLSVSTVKTFLESHRDFDNMLFLIDNLLDQGIASVLFVSDLKARDEFKARFNMDFVNAVVYKGDFVTLLRDGKETTVPVHGLRLKEEVLEQEKSRFRTRFSPKALGSIYELIYAYLTPNVFYNEEETARRKTAAANAVLSTRGKVVKDLEIVGKNQLVTPEIFRKIYSLEVAQDALHRATGVDQALPLFGRLMVNLFILLLFIFYLKQFRRESYYSTKSLACLCLIFAIHFAFIAFTHRGAQLLLAPVEWEEGVALGYLLPFVLGPMLVTVLYDLELGCAYAVAIAFLTCVLLGFEFRVVLVHFIAGIAAAAGVRNIRYRAHFFLAFLIYSLAYGAAIAAMEFMKYGGFHLNTLLMNAGFAWINGAVCMMFLFPLVWIFEKLFGLTTNLTYIELTDMNTPVLKRLALEAPGTYHHSVLIGNLAESAAEAIGANPLKTRVLAYYHDIGKVFKAEYFIENQSNLRENPHEKISPSMSALIVASHVKQGVELARKYQLPQAIEDVIREHHGTSLISFFYEKAAELDPGKKPSRDDFSYPGPKPRSKESALIMLADSVEATSRSLSEPTVSRLKSLVHQMVDKKFTDGQLDDCDLTLRDLTKIKGSFMRTLTGMFHARIEYPEGGKKARTHLADRHPFNGAPVIIYIVF